MSWGNQIGFCPNCKALISANDFITGDHDSFCEKSQSSNNE